MPVNTATPPELAAFLAQVAAGQPVAFRETLDMIAAHYDYRPARFHNGLGAERLTNEPGINEGSCKIFAFARCHGLPEAATLALFGEYYRDEVLPNPDGEGHKNIRAFMKHGWAGVAFESEPLTPRFA
ncbi:HopJ type III effector protein [Methylomagnum ishizawai]|uniref:HopJ type III effector protein n=1 Tax=Methylomagnum ishizawai TaxID=1760988 RepID=A0A1Y6D2K6_9GAMM|nr:HopJ type III effector protein [Methylomagnum ishizawai]